MTVTVAAVTGATALAIPPFVPPAVPPAPPGVRWLAPRPVFDAVTAALPGLRGRAALLLPARPRLR
ncbi:hypothetical protein, partial [Paracraurococcus ruber]